MKETRFKQTDIGLIPEDWEVKGYREICENFTGLTYCPDDVAEYGSLVLRSSNIKEDKLSFDNNVYVSCNIPDRTKVKEGDVLVCVRNGSRSLLGKSARISNVPPNTAFGAFMTILRAKEGNSQDYILYLWQSSITQNQIGLNANSTINQITNYDLASMMAIVPSLPEQGRIAEALSDMDGLLSSLNKLIEKKRNIKTATMQQLLTGKKRLHGFSDPWKEVRLGDVFTRVKGTPITANFMSNISSANGKIKIFAGGKTIINANLEDIPNAKIINRPAVLIQSRGIIDVIYYDKPFTFKNEMWAYVYKEEVTLKFLSYYLKQNIQSLRDVASSMSTIPQIAIKDTEDYIISLPSLPEQTAIADILSSMDGEIDALERKREKYQAIKKGMMQELLSGRIRLI